MSPVRLLLFLYDQFDHITSEYYFVILKDDLMICALRLMLPLRLQEQSLKAKKDGWPPLEFTLCPFNNFCFLVFMYFETKPRTVVSV